MIWKRRTCLQRASALPSSPGGGSESSPTTMETLDALRRTILDTSKNASALRDLASSPAHTIDQLTGGDSEAAIYGLSTVILEMQLAMWRVRTLEGELSKTIACLRSLILMLESK